MFVLQPSTRQSTILLKNTLISNGFMDDNPGKTMDIYPSIISVAYPLVFTRNNILAEFMGIGICLFNRHFCEYKFNATFVTTLDKFWQKNRTEKQYSPKMPM